MTDENRVFLSCGRDDAEAAAGLCAQLERQCVSVFKDDGSIRERLQRQAREWTQRKGPARIFGLAGWPGPIGFRGLTAPGTMERRYLRWSLASFCFRDDVAGTPNQTGLRGRICE
jgi:hypothetical protein